MIGSSLYLCNRFNDGFKDENSSVKGNKSRGKRNTYQSTNTIQYSRIAVGLMEPQK